MTTTFPLLQPGVSRDINNYFKGVSTEKNLDQVELIIEFTENWTDFS